MPTAKGIKSIVRLMKNGERRNERKIRGAMKWTHIIDTTRNGVEDMISAIVWFGIGAICGAMMLVAYSVITFDERTKGQSRGTNVPTQPTVPKMPEMQEKEDGKRKKHSDDNGLSHSEGKADEG